MKWQQMKQRWPGRNGDSEEYKRKYKSIIPTGTWLPCQHVKQMVLNFRLGIYIPSKLSLLIAFGNKKLTIFNNANSKLMYQHHTLL